jgi:pyruvate dehydrogenase E1 component alpha subunit
VEFYHKLLREMLLVRRFEERAGEAYAQGLIGGFCHLYIGQEAVAVGALAAIRKDDYVFASYREHAHALVQGTSSRAIMAELFGKAAGCSGGKGGSMHLFDVEHNFMGGHGIVGAHLPLAAGAAFTARYRETGGHGIVGAHLPLAAGAAFTARYRETDQVALCFFGEAAVNIGAFHETLNMAALWELPVVFVCENNRYGMGTALERAAAVWDVYRRACSYDMAEETVDGMDVLAVHGAVTNAVTRARDEQLPTLIEARTYRYMGHSMADPIHGHYRTKEELEEQKGKDPIQHLIDQLQGANLLTDETLEQTRQSVEEEVDDALRFADESPDPDPDELFTDVYRD